MLHFDLSIDDTNSLVNPISLRGLFSKLIDYVTLYLERHFIDEEILCSFISSEIYSSRSYKS